jgi:hypothetical protein
MSLDTAALATPLIDVTGLTLEDLEQLGNRALTEALQEVLTMKAEPTSAGFSSRLRRAAP